MKQIMIQKLTSRKFLAMVTGIIIALLTIFGVDDVTIQQVLGIIAAISAIIAYIHGESKVDIARINNPTTNVQEKEEISFKPPTDAK